MSYTVEQMYLADIPQTVLEGGLATRGIACHWTAGNPGREGAVRTAKYFITVAETRNASYHELWWWDAATQAFGAIEIVPNSRAAHSMNPNQPPAGPWDPNAEVRRILGDKWWNPNSYSYAISFAGMPADLEKALDSPMFVLHAARRMSELLAREPTITDLRPLFNHGWGQPSTRYDAGDRFIPAIYAAMSTLPNTATGDERVNVVRDVVRFNPPRRWTPKITDTINGYDGKGAVVKTYKAVVGVSGAKVAAVIEFSGDNPPGGIDGIRMGEVIDGALAGTYANLAHLNVLDGIDPDVVVKEVPTGITQDDVTNAEKAARAAGIKDAAAAAAATK